ncbi:MAG: CopG family ribbon-helix-helix protein [Acidobacteriaceae bacterium]
MSSVLSVRVSDEVRTRLDALAKTSRRSKSFLAAEAIEAFVENETWQLAEIQAGIQDLDAGRTADHADVRGWVESWGREREKKLPR